MIFISSEFFEVLLLLNLPKSSVAGTFVDVGSFMPPAQRGDGTERAWRGGEWWLVGDVIFLDVFWVFQNWVNPFWCSMFQSRNADSKTELDLRKPQRYFDKISCLFFLDDHSSCPLLFSNSNSGIWIWQALRNIRRRSCFTCITDGSPLVHIKPHSPGIKKKHQFQLNPPSYEWFPLESPCLINVWCLNHAMNHPTSPCQSLHSFLTPISFPSSAQIFPSLPFFSEKKTGVGNCPMT